MTESYELYRKDSPSTSVEAAESIEPNKLERQKRFPSHHLMASWIHALEAKIEIKTK